MKGVAGNVSDVQCAFEFGRRHGHARFLQVGEDRLA